MLLLKRHYIIQETNKLAIQRIVTHAMG